ncbi:hypothetical protein Zm00014a_012242 [Zea mays]|uniref:Uncharacterized protein n=1 Tax=Zea mays TaxID=4577 RepID=A0A3L6F4D5_MAIZE|nr:hypothetical protein Zm00014a_012242 [Zea mays]
MMCLSAFNKDAELDVEPSNPELLLLPGLELIVCVFGLTLRYQLDLLYMLAEIAPSSLGAVHLKETAAKAWDCTYQSIH